MKRRHLLRNGLFVTAGASVLGPLAGCTPAATPIVAGSKRAKNIIFLVSDGMSQGTLTMADHFLQRRDGRHSHWIQLYRDNRVVRSLMDTCSANSLVTDSAAAGSSWGGGMRINNGALNIGPNGERPVPILQKFKQEGKAVGCVTTVPITHATPASFCINNESRKNQPEIAEQYIPLKFDVMMGGGLEHFTADGRKDGKNVLQTYRDAGYAVALTKSEVATAENGKPLLAVFHEDGLPYTVDHLASEDLKSKIPTLAEMTATAIGRMKSHPEGFVMQVEAGKVDWAAHGNDVAGLIFDQIAFDDAVKVAMDFAEQDGETLVIITTDHGNSNPGLFHYKGIDTNANFDRLQRFTCSNEWVLHNITKSSTAAQIRELVESVQTVVLSPEDCKTLVAHYAELDESQLRDPYSLPFEKLAQMQKKQTSVAFGADHHSSDLVELAAFGPGSELLKQFTINTDLHNLMLKAAQMPESYLVGV
jgi:alkaline phosphatase